MKEQAIRLASARDPLAGMNLLREYLQALILRSLHESEAFKNLAFVGGTALRFLHNLPRFSEDLDFCLFNPDGYEPEKWLKRLKRELLRGGFDPELTWNDHGVVHKGMVKFPGLLWEAGLAERRERKISIKLEIDSRPPPGAGLEKHILTRHLTFFLTTHDIPSLFAGKLHALLCRPYPKGRDWFDLVWYLSHRPPVDPNLNLLRAALNQTHPESPLHDWRAEIRARAANLAPDTLKGDIRPFLERPEDAALLDRESLRMLLSDK